jgi:[ribosomal protein S5]-alanine N-acetyltransferase
MTAVETERLIIRNFRHGDAGALHEIIVRYQASAYAAYDHPWPTDADEIRKITAWFAGGDAFLAVCLKKGETLIGFVALNAEGQPDRREYNLGYCFHPDYRGKVYAPEACRAVIGHAFEQRQAQRLVTETAAANVPSCRLLERLGFARIGEGMASFVDGPDGKPLQFLGYTYALPRGQWLAAGERGNRGSLNEHTRHS